MNNQLKLLLYILFIVGVLFYLQDSFDLLDISFVSDKKGSDVEVVEDDGDLEGVVREEKGGRENYVVISVGEEGSVYEGIKVHVEVADTEPLRALGLSNRRYLGHYNGMLFVFDENVNNPFWMKDTLINLDIIFIDEKGFIVDIKEDNEPCTEDYCPLISSSQEYRYVLEVNGGFCEINGVKVGQSIIIHLARSN
jgi:uncharacterized membrane protein (UPF0127 family)